MRRNTDSAGKAPQLEPGAGLAALGAVQAKAQDTVRFLVRVTSRRRNLLDQDNLCEKFHVDCLRYAAIIPSDAPTETRIEVTQEKVGKGEAEEIIIQVTPL